MSRHTHPSLYDTPYTPQVYLTGRESTWHGKARAHQSPHSSESGSRIWISVASEMSPFNT